MKEMIVPSTTVDAAAAPAGVLERLAAGLETLTPQVRKAAAYVLENPNDVGVTSIREIAESADVKPNSFVRMARAVGFDGYDEFRQPFRDRIREGRENYPDRVRWLQSLSHGGKLAGLYKAMAEASLANIESLYSAADAQSLKRAADAILAARQTFVLGVGVAHAVARNFAYLAGMAVDNVRAIPRDDGIPIDSIARAGQGDVLLAMTFRPYRREVVEAVAVARDRGVSIVGLSDSPASPVLLRADHRFVIPVDTPQFFASTVALAAFLETLMAFVIADADPEAIENIEEFHRRRREFGIYWDEESPRP
ncbi:MAG: MurR/RpiR family transcriptional regulator [Rhodospirillaceae bacterium]|nr:MurR/RpiR family transcriptional regulator [Rhodospirillaceae bacterium]MYB12778.1 MurR/RpiR family transcriptional regulator [Rhodospirillaceae bacterium]MYI49518.1 MurR/RpiR family transcriptional regulator [Rhodospirillaceae bacterium]